MALNPLQLQHFGTGPDQKRQKLARDQFDSDAYLKANPDVVDAGVDAWTHYNDWGGADQWWRPWAPRDQYTEGDYMRHPDGNGGFISGGGGRQMNWVDGQWKETSAYDPAKDPYSGQYTGEPIGGISPVSGGSGSGSNGSTAPGTPTQGQPQGGAGAAPGVPSAPPARSGGPPPPPPPLPGAPPMPPLPTGANGAPQPVPVDQPGGAPDFMKLAQMAPAQMGQQYQTAAGGWQGEELSGELNKFARESLANPSRWDQPLVKESLGLIDQGIARNRADATRQLDERMSSRGLAGDQNSIAWDEGMSLEERLSRVEAERKNALSREMANTLAQDRAVAGNIGIGAGNFGRNLGADRRAEGHFGAEFNNLMGRQYEDDMRARTGFNMEGGGQTENALMARALFGLSSNNQLFNQGMQGAQFGEGIRRYDQGFAEDMRRDNRNFGEDTRRFDADYGLRDRLGTGDLDVRREEAQARINSEMMGIVFNLMNSGFFQDMMQNWKTERKDDFPEDPEDDYEPERGDDGTRGDDGDDRNRRRR